jgi:signal transduction histidine kinase
MMATYSEEPELKLSVESVREMVTSAHKSAEAQLASDDRSFENVSFEATIPRGLTARVSKFHLQMVLTNLIKNGIESHAVSEKEVKPGIVRVNAHLSGDDLLIEVSDQGRGITPEDLAQLLEFIPGGSAKKKGASKNPSGTGYGLPICQRYLEAHGGRISIKSEAGTGTVILIRLPHKLENGGNKQ